MFPNEAIKKIRPEIVFFTLNTENLVFRLRVPTSPSPHVPASPRPESPRPHVPTSNVPKSQPTRPTSQTRVPRPSPQVPVPLLVTASG